MQSPIAAIQAAAMPKLYDRKTLNAGTQIHVLYAAPEHEIVTPKALREMKWENIAEGAGAQLIKISPSMVVKFGSHASLIEASAMMFIAENTHIPIPKLYAAYAHGPFDRDVSDYGSVYDTYIFMEFIEGKDLSSSWDDYHSFQKLQIMTDLKRYLKELRSLPAPGYIGSANRGPVTDVILEWSSPTKGPFESEDDFHDVIIAAFSARCKGREISKTAELKITRSKRIVYTHGDIRPANIIVRDSRVVAILDWELSGWYPEYWEFVKAFYTERSDTNWASHIEQILEPFYDERSKFLKLMEVLW